MAFLVLSTRAARYEKERKYPEDEEPELRLLIFSWAARNLVSRAAGHTKNDIKQKESERVSAVGACLCGG